MNASLIKTARDNRIAALAYLQDKKQRKAGGGQVLCLKTMRERLQPKPVFLTRRTDTAGIRIAA